MLEVDKQDGEVTTTLYDKPRNPLAWEMFVNVDDPKQKADYEALAEQAFTYSSMMRLLSIG